MGPGTGGGGSLEQWPGGCGRLAISRETEQVSILRIMEAVFLLLEKNYRHGKGLSK